MWVFDASPLIYLAKVEALDLVDHLDSDCAIPDRVHAEVVDTGREQGYPDARRIERAIETDRFDVVVIEDTPLLDRLRDNPNLSAADAAVLALASGRDGTAVMDEAYGRDVAATEGITTRGTAFIVLRAADAGAITPERARTVLDEMLDAGWYCSPDVYAKLVGELESLTE